MELSENTNTNAAPLDAWVAIKEQALNAAFSGGIACGIASVIAVFAPTPIASIGLDALRTTLLLTAGVPPLILLSGKLLTRGPRRSKKNRPL
jgi:hypothetical protein